MSEILDFIGIIKDIVIEFPQAIFSLIGTIITSLLSALHFIVASIAEIPKIVNIGLFDDLPSFFSYGIYSLIGVMVLVTVFKLVQMFKFW